MKKSSKKINIKSIRNALMCGKLPEEISSNQMFIELFEKHKEENPCDKIKAIAEEMRANEILTPQNYLSEFLFILWNDKCSNNDEDSPNEEDSISFEHSFPNISKDSRRSKEAIRSQFEEKKRYKEDYDVLLCYLIYDFFKKVKIPFPEVENNIKPRNKEELCNVIIENQSPLTSAEDYSKFLFGISSSDFRTRNPAKLKNKINKKLSGWKLKVKNIDKFTITHLAEDIMVKASAHPFYDYLIRKHSQKYQFEIITILKRMVKEENGEIELDHPVISMINWAYEIAQGYTKNRGYTIFDFIIVAGALAKFSKDNREFDYILTEENLNELYLKAELNDMLSKWTWNSVVKDIRKSSLNDPTISDGFRFKLRPFRVVLAGIYDATIVNHKNLDTVDIIPLIESYFPPMIENKIRLSNRFKENNDDYCFYAISLLYTLDHGKRNSLIIQFCEYAKNFSVANRQSQINYIYILCNILASKLNLDSKIREKVFFESYSHTLYEYQALYWNHLIKTSSYYPKTAKNTFEKTFQLQSGNFAEPYFFFSYGLILKKDHKIANNAPFSEHMSADDFLKRSAWLQTQTWYSEKKSIKSNTGSCNEVFNKEPIISQIKDGCFWAAKRLSDFIALNNDQIYEKSSEILKWSIGTQYLAYTISNLINFWGVEEKVWLQRTNGRSKDDILKSIFFSDYFFKLFNPRYPMESEKTYLLCGSYRVFCALDNLSSYNSGTRSHTKVLYKSLLEKYISWLDSELDKKCYRYACLMLFMLFKVSDISSKKKLQEYIKNKREILNIALNEENFLSYDNYEKVKDLLG